MTEPFAKVREVGSSSELVVAGESIKWTYAIDRNPHRLLRQHAASINTAARKYAADKIREAADFEDGLALIIEKNIVANEAHYRKYPGGKPGQLQAAREKREAARRLRSRANTVEIGEA